MKLFNDEVALTAQDINTQAIVRDDTVNIYYPIINERIRSNFTSKYEKRKISSIDFAWIDELHNFFLIVVYDNADVISLNDNNIFSFMLDNRERSMLRQFA